MKLVRANLEVSSPLAITFLMILSFLVAWFTVIESHKILDETKNGLIVNIQQRTNLENLNVQFR